MRPVIYAVPVPECYLFDISCFNTGDSPDRPIRKTGDGISDDGELSKQHWHLLWDDAIKGVDDSRPARHVGVGSGGGRFVM